MAEVNKKQAADMLSSCYKMRFTDDISQKRDKAKFVGAYKKFSSVNGQFPYKGIRVVIRDKQSRRDIVTYRYRYLGKNIKRVLMSSHLGRTSIH